jgi:hypothetical protein
MKIKMKKIILTALLGLDVVEALNNQIIEEKK